MVGSHIQAPRHHARGANLSNMNVLSRLFSLFCLTATLALAGQAVNADTHAKVALQAYDPVAFFTDSKAMKGNPKYSATHDGYMYLFASEEHKKLFEQQPDKYLPAYGGYCAYAMSKGKFFPVDIETWEIVDGRLVLQFSSDVKKKFAEDKEANLHKADANWSKLGTTPAM